MRHLFRSARQSLRILLFIILCTAEPVPHLKHRPLDYEHRWILTRKCLFFIVLTLVRKVKQKIGELVKDKQKEIGGS